MKDRALMDKAVRFMKTAGGTVQMRMQFLRQQGFNDIELLEVLNEASSGELLRAAGVD